MMCGVGNGSFKVDDGDKGYTSRPKVLQLSTSNPVASRKVVMWSLHQKLAAGYR